MKNHQSAAMDVEALLIEEFLKKKGNDAQSYELWKADNRNTIEAFCEAVEEKDQGKFDAWLKGCDEKMRDFFFLVSVRAKWTYSTEKSCGFLNKRGKKAISQGFQYLVKDRWTEGIACFRDYFTDKEYERAISGGIKSLIKDEWMEGLKKVWENFGSNCQTLAKHVLKAKWPEGMKFVSIFFDGKDKYDRYGNRRISLDKLIQDQRISELKFLLNYDLCKAASISEAVAVNKWKEGLALLLKCGIEPEELYEQVISYSWADGVEVLLDKTEIPASVDCGRLYDIVIEKGRCDLLDRCLEKKRCLTSIHLFCCPDLKAVEDVVEIAEKHNPDGINWIARTDALYQWCGKYHPSVDCCTVEQDLEKWQRLVKADFSWCSDVKTVETVTQIAKRLACGELNEISQFFDLDRWWHDVEWKLVAEFLIKHGADVNRYGEDTQYYSDMELKGEYYITPLHAVVQRGEYGLAKLLLEYGAFVNAGMRADILQSPDSPYEGMTPLGLLSWSKDYSQENQEKYLTLLELLVKNGAKTVCLSQKQPTVFLHLVQICYELRYAPKNIVREKVLSLIAYVCQNGEDLYKSFARWDDREKYADKPYWMKSEKRNYSWIEYDHKQCIAESRLSEAVLDILTKYGLDINSNFGLGRTLLHYRAIDGEGMITYLIKKGANVNAKDFYGHTPLIYTLNRYGGGDNPDIKEDYMARNIIEAYRVLVAHGADENATDDNGNKAKELLELWEERDAGYEEAYAGREEADTAGNDDWMYDDEPSIRSMLDEKYGEDEDAMHSDPDYWDHMYGLTDD